MHAKSCLAERVEVYNPAVVEIREGATISQGTWLCTASHDFDDPEHPLVTAPIRIDRGAWLAGDVFVGPGVTVGEEAVALARAVLVKDVQPSDVVGGNLPRFCESELCHERNHRRVNLITHNESLNIRHCLERACRVGFVRFMWLILALQMEPKTLLVLWGAEVVHHDWPGYARQRNWAPL